MQREIECSVLDDDIQMQDFVKRCRLLYKAPCVTLVMRA